MAVYVVLAPHDPEQNDLLNIIFLDKNLEKLPQFKALLKCFKTMELMRWPLLKEIWAQHFDALPVFKSNGEVLWKDLRKRVMEHVS